MEHVQNYKKIAKIIGKDSNNRRVDRIEDILKPNPSDKILEIGCGCGGDAERLASITKAQIYALDSSMEMLSKVSPPVIPILANAAALPFSSRVFDGIYMANTLHLIDDKKTVFTEVYRTLKSGGKLVLPLTLQHDLQNRFLNQFFPTLYVAEAKRYPSFHYLSEILQKMGFRKIFYEEMDLGNFQVNRNYLKRQKAGIFSGLSLLSASERREGFRQLEKIVLENETNGSTLMIPWHRSIVSACKV